MRTFVTDRQTDRLTDGAGYIGPEERVQKAAYKTTGQYPAKYRPVFNQYPANIRPKLTNTDQHRLNTSFVQILVCTNLY